MISCESLVIPVDSSGEIVFTMVGAVSVLGTGKATMAGNCVV